MKSYVQEGDIVTLPAAPYAVSSGNGVLVGSLFGIATADIDNGAAGEIKTRGVFDVAKVSAQAWTVGELIYWDDAAKDFTSIAISNKLVGVAVLAAANPSASGRVRLNGAFIA